MKKLFSFLMLCQLAQVAFAQLTIADSGTYFIHKFEQHIGEEKYTVDKINNNLTYHVAFKYIDRGSPVILKADIQVQHNLEPLSFVIKGGTSRFSEVNDSVVVHNKMVNGRIDSTIFHKNLQPNSFPIAGYSPATAQMLLVQYWNKHNRPQQINMLPMGNVQINKDGEDTILFNQQPLQLYRYVIKGLIWGNELLWTDNKGQLFCLITNDAEGDKQEMMWAPYEHLLPVFVEKAAVYGMRLFTNNAKPTYQQHPIVAIKNGTMLDVVNNTTVVNTVIIINNGIITNVGSGAAVTIPANAFVIDAQGKTILPGLWDMHAHFEQAEWGPAYLAAGVTTVRDCGNEFAYINTIQKAINEERGVGPHILKAGIIDGKGPFALGIIQADNEAEAIAAVKRYNENGFVQIKIYSSVKPAIVKVICNEAHKLGLTVTGHIPNGMTLMQGVDSGMDMVNHVQYVSAVLKKDKVDRHIDFSDSTSKAVFGFLKEHHTVVDPTVGVFEMAYRSLNDSITIIEPNFASLPEPMKPLFLNTGMADAASVKNGVTTVRNFLQITNALYQNGIPIVAGTDMNFPGFSLDRELELYVQAGLTPMQAIQTATITPAKVMKLENETGSIGIGKKADLIIVDGNPLENIRNLRNVKTVIKDGHVYDPKTLHKMAGFQ